MCGLRNSFFAFAPSLLIFIMQPATKGSYKLVQDAIFTKSKKREKIFEKGIDKARG